MQAHGVMDELEKKRRHIRTLMRYAVPDEAMDAALDLLLIFRDDRTALAVLEEFYSFLPEAKNDWIKELRLVARQRGVFLIAAVASEDAYLYLVSSEGIEFNGSLREGWLDRSLLDFFEFASAEVFQNAAKDVEQLPEYQPLQLDADLCPACQAATGEPHELGCPVEICPWCGGQLIHCDCRFEQLGVDEMNERDLLRFEVLLEEQGRVAYSPEQRPSFADEGPGVELDE
ncbi:hypothetical protein [Candidatus Electronema sp. JM]|uniref:hypothetical protein n=1 Tax=Candidatus Electronema sp. JM TaxID=3401571 RepID=UPI003AA830C9